MTLDKFFSGFKKKWRKNLYYNFYFQNVHKHLQFEIAHALQLIGADSGEAVSESEAYLELARNIKNWIQIYLTTAGKGLIYSSNLLSLCAHGVSFSGSPVA